ncbi:outer membrane beta-barrel protein [Brumicola blandensis]|uniref:Outer membrane beta-barrel protein n=1 Tax=Brumicola blandensis TaxID=3075611 RepID=A0AAW8R841_9ALTE|nr:outer membrane beta-barrel protein [Alteromonas sp. W409]MDT0584080.1 outer membrane beta-barrel protein [Alteromonas sp. W409]
MKFTKTALIVALTSSCALAHAQQFEDASSIEFGGFDLTPTLDVGFRYDDNITRASQNETSSWSQIISPQAVMLTNFGSSQVTVGYRLRNERFFSSPIDNYTDHFFEAGVEYELNSRHRLDIGIDFSDTHEDRGTGFSIGSGNDLNKPDQFKQAEFDILYSYGAFNADGRLDLNFNVTNRDYDISTPQYMARDRTFSTLGSTFYYRVGATTDLVFDIIHTDVRYKFDLNADSPLDSTQVSYLIGLDWEATAQTSGYAKIGYQEKDFDSPFREDFDGVDWEAGVLWEPVEYSTVELTTGANTNETNGEGNFIRGRDYQVEWRHEWLDRLRTRVSYTWGNDRYEGQTVGNIGVRQDDLARFRASMYYQFRRWINFELGYIRDERDSNRATIVYDRNQILINALFTL